VDNVMMKILPGLLVAAALCAPVQLVRADEDVHPPAAAASAPPEPEKPRRDIEGALGPVLLLSPEYEGASRRKVSVAPGFFLRWGRYSISNTGAFVTRRNDDVFRGLGIDLKHNDRLRYNLALRIDNGRRSNSSEALKGLDNVQTTVRGRVSATLQLEHGFKSALGWSPDLLGRGGGSTVDVGLSHDRILAPGFTWNVGTGLSWGNSRYMRSYFGITPSESVRSGYAVYTPGAGLRDATLATGWRLDIDRRWVAFWGGGVSRVLGPAAQSPLTMQRGQWSLNGGAAWRF
jgi:outer membrane protein